ncbi:MAG: protein kinase, partial [Spirochaetales bacterium]|nr:protein kinase [Spirochaetales bacterium]
ILKDIKHPSIPLYYNDFKEELKGVSLYCLIQQYIHGDNLYTMIKSGHSFNEMEVITILKVCLKTLDYLHSLKPQVIHRDINPKNIILDESDKVYLVDFGAVGRGRKDTYTGVKSDTFVGTLGYMPPEQLFGKVHSGLDIYALGATILFLLSGKQPWEFGLKNMRIDFRRHTDISKDMEFLIDKMIEPDENRRLASAKKALSLVQELEDYIETEVKIKKLTAKKSSKSHKDQTSLRDSHDWLEVAKTKKKEAEALESLQQRESERKEEIARLKEKNRLKKQSDRERNSALIFPRRVRINEYSDSLELEISPYPLHLLFIKFITRLLRKFDNLNGLILLYSAPIIFWIGIIAVIWELLGKLDLSVNIVIFLKVLTVIGVFSVLFVLYCLIRALIICSDDYTLCIRVSHNKACVFHPGNLNTPIYVGPIKNLKFEVDDKSNMLPGEQDEESKFWGSFKITVTIPEPGVYYLRTGLPMKDIDTIRSFLKKIKNAGK